MAAREGYLPAVLRIEYLEGAAAIAGYLAVATYAAAWIFDSYVLSAVELGTPFPEALLAYAASVGILAAGLFTYWKSKGSEAGSFFLWASSMCSIATIAELMGRYRPSIAHVYFASIAMLAAFLVGFHIRFPPSSSKPRPFWTGSFCAIAFALSAAWLSGYSDQSPGAWRFLTYTLLATSVALSVSKTWVEGNLNQLEEYRWTARALSVILAAGAGFVAARGLLLPWLIGKPMLPVWTTYTVISAVALANAYTLFKQSPWGKRHLVPRTLAMASALAILAPLGILMFWFLSFGANALSSTAPLGSIFLSYFSPTINALVSTAVTIALLTPLYLFLSRSIDDLIYKGWYRHESLVENVISGIAEVRSFSEALDKAAELLRTEMKLEKVCVQEEGQSCWCWDGEWKESTECAEYTLTFCKSILSLSRHIDGSGLSKKDRWALRVIEEHLTSIYTHASEPARRRRGNPMPSPLTARELEVLELMSEGLSNKEIAEKLFVSVKTVEHHTTNIYRKLGVDGRITAVLAAERNGWINKDRA